MLLTGAATAACGPIAFVGLVLHVARFVAGVDYRWLVPYAAGIGGLLVLLADIIGRVVVRPGELPGRHRHGPDRRTDLRLPGTPHADGGLAGERLPTRCSTRGARMSTTLTRHPRREHLPHPHPAAARRPAVLAGAEPRRTSPWSALVVLAVLMALNLSMGDFDIPVSAVIDTLTGGGDPGQQFIIRELRLPQTLVAILVGAALGARRCPDPDLRPQPVGQPRHPRRDRGRRGRRRVG